MLTTPSVAATLVLSELQIARPALVRQPGSGPQGICPTLTPYAVPEVVT